MAEITRKPFNLKPLGARLNKDAESKPCVIQIMWAGATLDQIRAIATKQIVVDVQNLNRKDWAKFKAGHVFTVNAVDHVPGGDFLSTFKAMSREARREYLKANEIEI